MQATRTPFGLHWPLAEQQGVNERLNWLIAVNAREAERLRLFRTPYEEDEMRSMRLPIPTRRAFALFGLLLGLIVPAAIFFRIFGYGFWGHEGYPFIIFLICVAMNTACAIFGQRMGSVLSNQMDEYERLSWNRMIFYSILIGSWWGAATGFVGGLAFLGVGAWFGPVFAIPVAIVAYPLFTSLHRLMARGGMIDARHFWPLVFGVTMTIAMFIMGI